MDVRMGLRKMMRAGGGRRCVMITSVCRRHQQVEEAKGMLQVEEVTGRILKNQGSVDGYLSSRCWSFRR